MAKLLGILKKVALFDVIPKKYLPMTQILMTVNIVVFILQLMYPSVTDMGLFRADSPMSYITGCFLHGSIQHLLGNMLFLSLIFPIVESKYGSLFLFVAYIFTGAGGSALSAFFDPNAMGLGASGSIMGVMMLWIFHNLMKHVYVLIIPCLMYFMMQGIDSGISLIIPSNIGYLAHYGSALSAFFLLPYMIYKRVHDAQI